MDEGIEDEFISEKWSRVKLLKVRFLSHACL